MYVRDAAHWNRRHFSWPRQCDVRRAVAILLLRRCDVKRTDAATPLPLCSLKYLYWNSNFRPAPYLPKVVPYKKMTRIAFILVGQLSTQRKVICRGLTKYDAPSAARVGGPTSRYICFVFRTQYAYRRWLTPPPLCSVHTLTVPTSLPRSRMRTHPLCLRTNRTVCTNSRVNKGNP